MQTQDIQISISPSSEIPVSILSRFDINGSHMIVVLRHGVQEISEDDYYRPLDAPYPDTRIRLLLGTKEDQECSS